VGRLIGKTNFGPLVLALIFGAISTAQGAISTAQAQLPEVWHNIGSGSSTSLARNLTDGAGLLDSTATASQPNSTYFIVGQVDREQYFWGLRSDGVVVRYTNDPSPILDTSFSIPPPRAARPTRARWR